MTEEKTESVETTEQETATESTAAGLEPTIARLQQSAQELVTRVRETVVTLVRAGLDRTATSVERGSAHLTTVAERLHTYADTFGVPSEPATNAEG